MQQHKAASLTETCIPAGNAGLGAILECPTDARAIIIFVHGSGSGRCSPRNRLVAGILNDAGMSTLLFDLLTEDEARERSRVFDIPALTQRLQAATAWVRAHPEVGGLPIGYFGASTGAAAALSAAAADSGIGAVVSRGGRPDLAGDSLPKVAAPTLLIIGGHDAGVLRLNQLAARAMRCPHEIAVVPGATHLFEEPTCLERVAGLAEAWFRRHLVGEADRKAVRHDLL